MEKDRRARVVAIAALLVGVVGLSLGFAAFTNTLTIKSSAAVTVDDSALNVDFSSSSASVVDGNLNPSTLSPATSGPTGATATIDNSAAGAPEVRGLKASFTAPNQSVTYTFYTKNVGALKAYLTNVALNNITGESVAKKCTAKTGTTQSLVDAACNGISLTFTLGSETFDATTARASFGTATAHDLEVNASETVTVVIAYADGAAQADGDFDVAFGDIVLSYSSVA